MKSVIQYIKSTLTPFWFSAAILSALFFTGCMKAERVNLDPGSSGGILSSLAATNLVSESSGNGSKSDDETTTDGDTTTEDESTTEDEDPSTPGFSIIKLEATDIVSYSDNPVMLTMTSSLDGVTSTQNLKITTGGSAAYSFPDELKEGSEYSISVDSHPGGQNCDITSGSTGVAGITNPATLKCVRHLAVAFTYTTDATDYIKLIRVNPATQTTEQQISISTVSIQHKYPELFWDGSYYYLFYMKSAGNILFRKYDVEFTLIQADTVLASAKINNAINAMGVAMNDRDHQFLMIWGEDNSSSYKLYYTIFDSDANIIKDEQILESQSSGKRLLDPAASWNGARYVTAHYTDEDSQAVVYTISAAGYKSLNITWSYHNFDYYQQSHFRFTRNGSDSFLLWNETQTEPGAGLPSGASLLGINFDSNGCANGDCSSSPYVSPKLFATEDGGCSPKYELEQYPAAVSLGGNDYLTVRGIECETDSSSYYNVKALPVNSTSGILSSQVDLSSVNGSYTDHLFGPSITTRNGKYYISAGYDAGNIVLFITDSSGNPEANYSIFNEAVVIEARTIIR